MLKGADENDHPYLLPALFGHTVKAVNARMLWIFYTRLHSSIQQQGKDLRGKCLFSIPTPGHMHNQASSSEASLVRTKRVLQSKFLVCTALISCPGNFLRKFERLKASPKLLKFSETEVKLSIASSHTPQIKRKAPETEPTKFPVHVEFPETYAMHVLAWRHLTKQFRSTPKIHKNVLCRETHSLKVNPDHKASKSC